jgi:hypothetical protein
VAQDEAELRVAIARSIVGTAGTKVRDQHAGKQCNSCETDHGHRLQIRQLIASPIPACRQVRHDSPRFLDK